VDKNLNMIKRTSVHFLTDHPDDSNLNDMQLELIVFCVTQ